GYPLAQTYPISPPRESDRFLDVNRGLIPYRVLETQCRVDFSGALAQMEDVNTVDKELLWSNYFLPTLPGIEVDLLSIESGEREWYYRFSAPVLDESFAETTERPGESRDLSIKPRELDLTEVVGRKAFEFPLDERQLPKSGTIEASGWIPPTPENTKGVTTIEVKANDETTNTQLSGPNPTFQLGFPGTGIDEQTWCRRPSDSSAKDGRSVCELTANIAFEMADADNAQRLPTFSAKLSSQPSDHQIINNGQPLLAARNIPQRDSLKRVVSLDGEGNIWEEPLEGSARFRRVTEANEVECLTSRHRIHIDGDTNEANATRLQLEIVGVPLGKRRDEISGQRWMLHNGDGGWPRSLMAELY
ncbi:unnamed protein product, partial [Hapterophycus canaliculatus]